MNRYANNLQKSMQKINENLRKSFSKLSALQFSPETNRLDGEEFNINYCKGDIKMTSDIFAKHDPEDWKVAKPKFEDVVREVGELTQTDEAVIEELISIALKYNNITSHGLKDSGERREFDSGAVRDIKEGKGRCDLLPAAALLRLARHYEAGANKYEARNWEKGIPISEFIDSGLRHLLQYMDGARDEDHLVAAAWNLICAMWTEEKLPHLQDLPARRSPGETYELWADNKVTETIYDGNGTEHPLVRETKRRMEEEDE